MSTKLLPQAFWFRVAVPCRRVDGVPKSGAKGRLLDLPASCALPSMAELDDKASWADVRVAWNADGFAFQVEAKGTQSPSGERPEGMDDIQLWLDTRDTRDVSRATRFCHRFTARFSEAGARGALQVVVAQKPIARAVADAPMGRSDLMNARAERTRGGWRFELFLPADVLTGFDPDTNRRLGFAYHLVGADREDQFLGIGREFPLGENPSLWSTLELREVD